LRAAANLNTLENREGIFQRGIPTLKTPSGFPNTSSKAPGVPAAAQVPFGATKASSFAKAALPEKRVTRIIAGTVVGSGLAVGAGFGINGLVKKN